MSRIQPALARIRRSGDRRSCHRRDDGFTLIELLIATTIGFVILSVVMLSLPVFVKTSDNGVAFSQAVNRANTALTQIEQQVVAGQVIFNPATEGTNAGHNFVQDPGPGYSLRVLSSATRPTECYQWRVTTQQLQVRYWKNDGGATATGWVTLITGVENSGPTQVPFSLDTTPDYGDRLLKVDLVLKSVRTYSGTTRVQTSIAASNAEFFTKADEQFCTPVPKP